MQWFSWIEQSGCWVPAHSEFSKLFKCEDSIGAGTHHSFKLPESGAEIDGPSINGAHDMKLGSLFYHAPVADKISVALCLVGEARESTFQQFNGMPPVLDDIYSKIVEPLHADVYIVSSDERWREDKKSFPETDDAGKVLMEQYKSSALKSSIQLMRVERNHVPYGLNRDTSELLCPLGFTSSVLNVVMVQRWASCHQLIQAGELLRGRKYQIVMRWRPDIRPLTPFPSLDDPVWASVVPKHIIIPGYLKYFGSTAVQDQWAIMHRSDSYTAMVGASETIWQCTNKSELRRLCLGKFFDDGPVSLDSSLNLRQLIESAECIWTAHLHHSSLRAVLASKTFGQKVLWQYDLRHPGIYGAN